MTAKAKTVCYFLGAILWVVFGCWLAMFSGLVEDANALPPQAVIDYRPCVDFTATTSWTRIAPVDTFRKYLLIQNQEAVGGNILQVEFSSDADAPTTNGLMIGPGGNYEFFIPPWNATWMKTVSGTVTGCLKVGK